MIAYLPGFVDSRPTMSTPKLQQQILETQTFPFPWDVIKFWSTDGCKLSWHNDSATTCICTHLTSFSVGLSQFEPNINLLEIEDVRRLTISNIIDHPIPAILVVSVWVFCLLLIFSLPDHDTLENAPIIAKPQYIST